MKKKIVLILAASTMVYGCSSFLKSSNNSNEGGVVDSNYYTSFKGLTRDVAQVNPDMVSSDPNLIPKKGGGFFDCTKVKKVSYTFNGKAYIKPLINDDLALKCPEVRAFKYNMPWSVTKTEWTPQDEQDFGSFVKTIGYSDCNNLDICLSKETNPLRDEKDLLNVYYADCADLPYYLRAYFAYKKGLPFSFVSGFEAAPLTDAQVQFNIKTRAAIEASGDIKRLESYDSMMADARYPQNGNIPKYRYSIPAYNNGVRDFSSVKDIINDAISTGTYRMIGGDFYSPQISSQYIRPGTAVYGTKGHAAIIYDVKPNGEFLVIDAHPGNSISHNGWIQEEFVIDKPEKGGMFKNFRSVKVVNGKIQIPSDQEVPGGVSLEQYDSSNFQFQGYPVSMKEWMYLKISGGTYRVDPIQDLIGQTNQLCKNFQFRVADVQKAFDNGVTKESLSVYPNNIFGADGDWETYSTPSSDLRRRADTLFLVTSAQSSIKRVASKHPIMSYAGANLKADLASAFQKAAGACSITYKNSVGAPVTLNLLQLTKRVGQFAFDPYLCPEARWGASGAEMATCSDSADKKDIYRLTQFLRNNNEKDTKAIHGYTLDALRNLDTTKAVNNNPNAISYDVAAKILAL